MRGFTIIEALIAMLIAMVALLAIGSFFITVLDQGQVARERLAAVHLAESLLEDWQNDAQGHFPDIKPDCSTRAFKQTRSYPVRASCSPTSSPVQYTITADVVPVKGPLPPAPLTVRDFRRPAGFVMQPLVKVVRVAWKHKQQSKDVFLMHVSQVK
ncbi:MAG: hypothetical protein D6703_04005 [Zetaproteobacteria bacterium]|nr:MAG: hypothetical protein D6703_04005 [Zetaproteobacteria bacterium]